MNDWGIGWTTFWLMLLLGAYHGVNPGMGWLFAVALGMQENTGRAVATSLVPIVIGHMFAIGIVVLAAALLGTALPSAGMRYPVAAVLVGLGIYRSVHHRHPRWVRMQVGFRDLVVWSFLMASAHGAGLMVLPVLLDSHPSLEAADDTPGHAHLSTGVRPVAATAGHRRSHRRLSRGHRGCGLGCLSETRPRSPSQGVAQSRPGLGRCSRDHRPGHTGDVAVGPRAFHARRQEQSWTCAL